MAKQTINIGASANDGTGTPLRTAFDYCNLNFTELYTAVGPSGNNIVCPGSATITGDLTVDTNVLKVDSLNNRVGINTATPAVDLHIQAAGSASAEVRLASATRSYNIGSTGSGYGSANNLIIYDLTGAAERYRLDANGNHFWNNVGGVAGTAMTLNANGLGVGVVPSAGKGALQLSSGINFPATQVASSDANTLDDYEEGTWTPVFADATTGGNVATAASAVGIYTKVGNLVTVQYQLESINTTGLTAGNTAYVRGLPFAVVATPASPGHVMAGNIAFGGFLSSNCVNLGTQILFYDCLTGGSISTRTVSNFTSGSASIYGSFTYRVA